MFKSAEMAKNMTMTMPIELAARIWNSAISSVVGGATDCAGVDESTSVGVRADGGGGGAGVWAGRRRSVGWSAEVRG